MFLFRESQDDPDSVFILFKKTDFNTILACLGGKAYRWWGHKIFVAKKGVAILLTPTFKKKKNMGPPSEENDSPLLFWLSLPYHLRKISISWAENAKVLSDIFWLFYMLGPTLFTFSILNFLYDEHLKLVKGSKLFFPYENSISFYVFHNF